jgi:hypothetical protein
MQVQMPLWVVASWAPLGHRQSKLLPSVFVAPDKVSLRITVILPCPP